MAALFVMQCTANVTSRERAHVTSKHGGGGIRDRNYCSSSRPGSPPLFLAPLHSLSQTQLTRYKVGGGLKTALISKTYRAARSSTDASHLASSHCRIAYSFWCFPCLPCSLFSSFSLLLLLVYLGILFVFLHPTIQRTTVCREIQAWEEIRQSE